MAIRLPSQVVGRHASDFVEVSNIQAIQVGGYGDAVGIATDEHGVKHVGRICWVMGDPWTTDIADPHWFYPVPGKFQIEQPSQHYYAALGQMTRESEVHMLQFCYDKALFWLQVWNYAQQHGVPLPAYRVDSAVYVRECHAFYQRKGKSSHA